VPKSRVAKAAMSIILHGSLLFYTAYINLSRKLLLIRGVRVALSVVR
jgi:hypothetical protein